MCVSDSATGKPHLEAALEDLDVAAHAALRDAAAAEDLDLWRLVRATRALARQMVRYLPLQSQSRSEKRERTAPSASPSAWPARSGRRGCRSSRRSCKMSAVERPHTHVIAFMLLQRQSVH